MLGDENGRGEVLRPLREDGLQGLRPAGGRPDGHQRQLANSRPARPPAATRRRPAADCAPIQPRADLVDVGQFRQERGAGLRRRARRPAPACHGVEGPVTEGLADQGVVARHRRRDHEDRAGTTLHDLPRGLRPVHSRHQQVHQDDVGRVLLALADRLFAAGRGPGDGMLGLAAHDPPQGLRGDPQVVDDRDPHASASPISSRTAWIKVSS